MNIPPKYEDVVAQLEAALGREVALREEMTKFKSGCVDLSSQVRELEHKMDYYKGEGMRADALQQRLTVAEQWAGELMEALEGMVEYFPEGRSDGECFSVERANAALKPAEEGEGS